MRRLALLLSCAWALAACHSHTAYRVTASVQSPELAYVSPGVYTVVNSDNPVFYSDNYYWRYDGGHWYRSHRYDRDYVMYEHPPETVLAIDRPYAYVHYRPERRAQRDTQPRYDVYEPRPQPPAEPWDPAAKRRPGPQPIPQDDWDNTRVKDRSDDPDR